MVDYTLLHLMTQAQTGTHTHTHTHTDTLGRITLDK